MGVKMQAFQWRPWRVKYKSYKIMEVMALLTPYKWITGNW